MVALIFAAFVLTVIGVDVTIQYMKSKKKTVHESNSQLLEVFDEQTVRIPKGIYFDKTHTWAFMNRNGKVEVGINDFLQNITGTPSRIEMKKTGDPVRKGDRLLTIIQDGKRLNIYSPVSGTVNAINERLINQPSLLNSAPYAEGWVYHIEPVNWFRETQFMLMADQTANWMKKEFSRLKDVLANAYAINKLAPVMQDGGALKGHILENAGPEVWEEFQTNFIDTIK
jgi:glycine cleavage system H lipoate-binding protein